MASPANRLRIAGAENRQRTPSIEITAKLVARALGCSTDALNASFAAARPEHLAGVVELRTRIFGFDAGWDDAAYLKWRYRFGSAVNGRGTCWVLVYGGRVIGMVGTEDIQLVDDIGAIPTISTMDLAVDAAFADSGLGVWMNMKVCGDVPLAITIGSNANSISIISRYFRRMPDRRVYVYPIDFARYLVRKTQKAWLANPIGAALNALMSLSRTAMLRRGSEFEVRPIEHFDGAFQALIDRVRQPAELHIQKSLEFLNWRLFGSRRSKYWVWGAFRSGKPAGYIAILNQSSGDAVTQIEIVDWMLAPADEERVFRTLCRKVVDYALSLRAERILVTAYHVRSERLLGRYGFIRRASKFETIGVAGSNAELIARVVENKNWCVMEINTDRDGV